jgi:hypothetical protein
VGLINPRLSLDKQQYRGGGPVKAETSIANSPNYRNLEVYGAFCGKIASTRARISSSAQDGEILKAVKQFQMSLALKRKSREIMDSSSEEEFWRIMLGDLYSSIMSFRSRIEQSGQARSALQHDINLLRVSSMPAKMLNAVRKTSISAQLCTTTGNSVANVEGNVEVGGDIFVARGASIPLIICAVHSVKSSNFVNSAVDPARLYRLIGGSYVHRNMDGQILDER